MKPAQIARRSHLNALSPEQIFAHRLFATNEFVSFAPSFACLNGVCKTADHACSVRFKKEFSTIRPSKKFQLAFHLDKNRYAQKHSGFFKQKLLPTIFCTERAIRSYCHKFTFLKIPSKLRAYDKAQNAFFRHVFYAKFSDDASVFFAFSFSSVAYFFSRRAQNFFA